MYRIEELGHHYECEIEMVIHKGDRILVKKGLKLILAEKSFCMEDIHYFEKNAKSPIPKGTVVTVKYCWANFHGSYITVIHNDKSYELKPQVLKYDKNLEQ